MNHELPHALITGAASGIGLATARKAVARGWRVTVVDRDADRLAELFGDGDGDSGQGVARVVADLSDPAGFESVVDRAEAFHGAPPSVLTHCAGQYHIKPTLDLTLEDWRRTMDVNATSTVFLATAVARRLVAAGLPGSIVVLSSIAGKKGSAREPAVPYSASKAAVEAITRQLAIDFGPHGIRVNAVAPGLIETPMLRITDDAEVAASYVATALPMRRLGSADEVAEVCLFLAGPQASYISGAVVVVDGALTA